MNSVPALDTAAEDIPTALGIDVGTSSCKAVVVGSDGRLVAQASAEYPVRSSQEGWAETAPDDWWAAVTTCVREAVGRARVRPAAIGLSGQMHGLVLTDESGTPLRDALLWADARAASVLARYRALDPALRQRLANPLAPGMAGPLLAWVAEHETELYARSRWALQPKDWLRTRLTGRISAERSDASATLLYDLAADRWDADVVSALGLDRSLLPSLLGDSATIAGALDPDAATVLGLDAGIPVAAGAADTAAAALGTGVVRPDDVQLTVGTGAQIIRPTQEAVSRADAGVHLYRSAFPVGWYHMAACTNAGITLGWVCRTMSASWAELYASLEEPIRPTDPIFLPHLTGERTPYLDPALRGAWTGLSLTHDRRTMLRSALEGVAYAIAEALTALVGPQPPAALRLAGGGTVAELWRQLLSTVLRAPLRAVDTPAASGRGAALLGARAADLVSEEDITGRLAPATRLVAEPQTDRARTVEDRQARFHVQVLRLSERTADPMTN